ncbi:endonuclease [Pilimelia terevasa]|uniref:Endonuclease n=1 Tax=Pilimelia terevasa TaxID=53372 RepID=A0A8J3BPG5_9ACTN|nr:endonuclease/exonuclease/phosphatase family protein [Pilimelia terevasa]GGK18474.1 endonuclease [Pilimelia terevasa]
MARSRRRWGAPLWGALLAPFAAWAAVRGLGLERGPLIMVVAFTPYVAAAAVLPVLAAAAARRWRTTGVAAALALALAAMVLPRALPADAGPAGFRLRVVSANMLLGGASVADLAALVADRDADVVALQEFTDATREAVRAAGLDARLPYQVLHPLRSTLGSALYSRYPLRDTGVRVNQGGFTQAYGVLVPPGGPAVAVESVHPLAPAGLDALGPWRADLLAQPAATPAGPLRILAGDFNATLDHQLLRRLLDTGYRDAAATRGAGLRGTWGPYDGDLIPPVAIDHVLADRRIGVRGFGTRPLADGDHRAVWAELALPR